MSNKEKSAMRQGKKTARLVPQLRFPEFLNAGEWSAPKLADISTPVEERVGDKTLTPVSISAGIGFVPQAEKFGRDISGNQYRLYTVVRDGDFVYNKGNSLKFPQGCVYDLQGWGEVAAPNVFICFKLKKGYDNRFYRQYFEKNIHGVQLRKHITSGARSNGLLNISKDAFFGIQLPTPSHAEQKHIADCISSLETLIAAEHQKLEALKAHKKGLMQKLFPKEGEAVPQRRFPSYRKAPAWQWMAFLGVVSRSFYGTSSSTSDTGKYPVLRMGNMIDGRIDIASLAFIDMSDSEFGRFKLNEGDILLNRTNSADLVGKISLFSLSGDYVAASYIVAFRLKAELIDSRYCNYLLNSEHYQRKIRSLATRAISQANINPTSFQERLQIPVPSRPEQEAISDCFSALDESIIAQARKFDALKRQKIGLMQRLLPTLTEVDG